MCVRVVSPGRAITLNNVKRLFLQLTGSDQEKLLLWMKQRAEAKLRDRASGYEQKLTSRQVAVVRLTAKGCTTKQIAAALGIREKTVYARKTRIFDRLGLHRSVELVRYAVEHGLAPAPEERDR